MSGEMLRDRVVAAAAFRELADVADRLRSLAASIEMGQIYRVRVEWDHSDRYHITEHGGAYEAVVPGTKPLVVEAAHIEHGGSG